MFLAQLWHIDQTILIDNIAKQVNRFKKESTYFKLGTFFGFFILIKLFMVNNLCVLG